MRIEKVLPGGENWMRGANAGAASGAQEFPHGGSCSHHASTSTAREFLAAAPRPKPGGFAVTDTFELRLKRLSGYQFRAEFGAGSIAPLVLDEPPPLGGGSGPIPANSG